MAKRASWKQIKELSELALIVMVSVMVSGLPSTLATAAGPQQAKQSSKALTSLNTFLKLTKEQTGKPFTELRKAVLEARNGDPLALQNGVIERARYGLSKMRDGIQAIAFELGGSEDPALDVFHANVMAYYDFKGLLHKSYEAVRQSAIPANSSDRAGALDLVLPKAAADAVRDFIAREGVKNGVEIYNVPYLFKPAGTQGGQSMVRMSLAAREAARFRAAGFAMLPNEGSAEDLLRFQEAKRILARQSMLNALVYTDERIPIQLPGNADPTLAAIQVQTESASREAIYRKNFTEELVRPLSDAIQGNRAKLEKAAVDFYSNIGIQLSDKIDTERLSKFIPRELGEIIVNGDENDDIPKALVQALEIISKKFLSMEESRRLSALTAAITTSPVYLTEVSRDEVRGVVSDAVRAAVVSLALMPLSLAMFDLETLSGREQLFILTELKKLSDAAFNPEMLPDAALAKFEESRKDIDMITSFRRYDYAQKLLAASDWLENTREVLVKISKGKDVAPSLLPKKPAVGPALLALKPKDQPPNWALEMIQGLGSKAKGLKAQSDLQALRGIILSIPTQMLDQLNRIHDHASNSVLNEISELHSEYSSLTVYRFASHDERIRILGKRAKSEDAKRILLGFLKMSQLATASSAGILHEKLEKAFDALVAKDWSAFDGARESFVNGRADRASALVDLRETLVNGRAYVNDHRDLINKICSSEAERNEYLRKLLSDSETYKSYIEAHIQELQTDMPALFIPIKLSSKAQRETGNTNPVMLSDILARLKPALNVAAADFALGQRALRALNEEKLKDRKVLVEPAKTPLTPHDLIVSAMSGTAPDQSPLNMGLKGFVDSLLGRHESLIEDDSIWPEKFLVRDVLPAYFDHDSDAGERVRRVVVSNLFGTYLKAGLIAGRSDMDYTLGIKKGDVKGGFGWGGLQSVLRLRAPDSKKVLLQGSGYKETMAEHEDALSGGYKRVIEEGQWWRRSVERFKEYTAKAQEYSMYVFHLTWFFEIPPAAHKVIDILMMASSIFDLSADVNIFHEYWLDYIDLSPYMSGGMMGDGVVTFHQVEVVRNELHNRGLALVDRLPMDLFWYVSAGKGYLINRRLQKMMTPVLEYAKRNNIDDAELSIQMAELGKAYDDIKVPVNLDREVFSFLYKAKVDELKRAKDNAQAEIELERWNKAMKLTNYFENKFGEYVRMLGETQQKAMEGPVKRLSKKAVSQMAKLAVVLAKKRAAQGAQKQKSGKKETHASSEEKPEGQ